MLNVILDHSTVNGKRKTFIVVRVGNMKVAHAEKGGFYNEKQALTDVRQNPRQYQVVPGLNLLFTKYLGK